MASVGENKGIPADINKVYVRYFLIFFSFRNWNFWQSPLKQRMQHIATFRRLLFKSDVLFQIIAFNMQTLLINWVSFAAILSGFSDFLGISEASLRS